MNITNGAALHLAAATPLSGIMNVCDLLRYVGPRLDPSAPTRDDGFTTPLTAPGIGVNPDLDLLGALFLELTVGPTVGDAANRGR